MAEHFLGDEQKLPALFVLVPDGPSASPFRVARVVQGLDEPALADLRAFIAARLEGGP
jgi:hypothetical protein